MNYRYADDQAVAIKMLADIAEIERPEYIHMAKQKDGRYLITWEGEQA